MCGTELMRRSVRPAKRDRNIKLAARHRVHVRGVVNDLVKCYERKAERHEFNDRPQSNHGRADSEASKSVLTDWSIDDSPWAKALKQAVADFVRALVFCDLFAHQENVRIALELFRERLVERLAIRDFSHGFAPFAYV